MAREKLGEYLSSLGMSDKNSISYKVRDLNPVPGDDSRLDPGVDDLGRDPVTGKKLIGLDENGNPSAATGESLINDFVNYITDLDQMTRNYYSIKGGTTTAPLLSRESELGVPNHLRSAETDGQKVFADSTNITLSQYSDSGYLSESPDVNSVGDIVMKAGKPNSETDTVTVVQEGGGPASGNTLLSSVVGKSLNKAGKTFVPDKLEDKDQRSIKSVQSMLQSKNRFNTTDTSAYAPYDDSELLSKIATGEDGFGTSSVQSEFGNYDRNSQNIFINDDLKNIARSMIFKAVGLDSGDTPGESIDPNTFNPKDKISNILNNDVTNYLEEGKKFPRARESFGSPDGLDGGAFEVQGSLPSFGQTYTRHIPFSSQFNGSSAVIKARSAAIIMAMIVACQKIGNQISDFEMIDDEAYKTRSPKMLGQAKLTSTDAKIQIFRRYVIPATRYPIVECLSAGCSALFNLEFSETSIEDAKSESTTVTKSGNTIGSESAGFWHAIGKSMLKKFEIASRNMDESESYESDVGSAPIEFQFAELTRSGIIGVIRTLVQIGDIILYSTGASTSLTDSQTSGVKPFNVDLLPDGPQTRQSKSRSRTGQTSASLAWRNESAPGLYILPRNVIKAVIDMNNIAYGGNPVKGHTVNSLLPKTFIDPNPGLGLADTPKERSRIPTVVRRMIEDKFDSEYVPFYFHDIRTNEIIGFHAFLNNLSDGYTANYSTSQGYGRVDPVYIYKDTKRSVGFSFYIASTSKEDFDEMWFKINKLTTLVYPQWAKGTKLTDSDKNSFIQPFSQVIGATPLIRLRIGDVIKTNYSKFNLGRLFGIGDDEFTIDKGTFKGFGGASGAINTSSPVTQAISDFQLDYVFSLLYGSPMALLPLTGDAGSTVADNIIMSVAALAAEKFGGSPLLNPLGAKLIMGELANPDGNGSANPIGTGNEVLDSIAKAGAQAAGTYKINESSGGYVPNKSYPILKPSVDSGYKIKGTTNRIRTVAPYKVNVVEKFTRTMKSYTLSNRNAINRGTRNPEQNAKKKVFYEVEFFDLDAPNIGEKKLIVAHEDLMPNPDVLFLKRVGPALSAIGALAGIAQVALNKSVSQKTGIPTNALQLSTTDANEFIHPVNNPITRAFENSGGRGLAGVIRSLSYEWIDSTVTWETEWGSRAPKVVKVTVNFEPIHDIPPGIDHGGYNRAPNYNVGATMNAISGDSNPDEGFGSNAKYTRAASNAAQSIEDVD